jgi:hypothetical protein
MYIEHYWMRDGKYLTEPGENGSLQNHPNIPRLDVKIWTQDERGVDICYSWVPDNTVITEVTPGIRIITEEEFQAVLAAQPQPEPQPEPEGQPDWNTFKQTAVASTNLNTFVGELMSIAPVAATALPATLLLLESGTYTDFENTWTAIENATTVPADLITEMVALAESCNLPQEFVSIFAA